MDKVEITKIEQMPVVPKDAGRIEVSSKTLEDLSKRLKKRFDDLATDRGSWEGDIAEAFNAYHLVPPNKSLPYEGYPNMRCILPRTGVDTMHANVMHSIFSGGDTAEVSPDYVSEGYVRTADKVSKYLTYQLKYESGFYEAVDDADFKAHNYGNGYLEPIYCKEHEWITEKIETEEEVQDPMTGEMKKVKRNKTKKRKRIVFDGIKIISLPIESIYRSPFIPTIKEAVKKDVVFKLTRHFIRDIKRLAKKSEELPEPFYMKSAVDELEATYMNTLIHDEKALEQAKRSYDGFTVSEIIEDKQVDLLEAHLWFDADGDGLPEKIVVVMDKDSGTILRVSFASCRIIELKPRPVDGRAFGESIYQAGFTIYEEWEAIHNARVAKGQWENMPFGFYNSAGMFNPSVQQIMPGHFYPTTRANDVVFGQPPPVGMSYYREEELLYNYFERVLGIADIIQGVAGNDKTATESLQRAQRASVRMNLIITRITHALSELLGHMYDLNRECAPKDKEFYLVGIGDTAPIFSKISREDYKSQMSFKINLATVFDQQLLRDTWLMAFRMFRMDPLINAHPAAVYQLFKNTLRGMGIKLDIPKPPQVNSLTPQEEHELIMMDEPVEPIPGEDVEEHLKAHKGFMETEKFKHLSKEQQQALIVHIDKTIILKRTLESANLNQSGMYDPGMMTAQQPGMTASRNPSQMFNNMRIGESGKSAQQNNMNDIRGNVNNV